MKTVVPASLSVIFLTLVAYVCASGDASPLDNRVDLATQDNLVNNLEYFAEDELDNSYESGDYEGSYEVADEAQSFLELEDVDEEELHDESFLQLENEGILHGFFADYYDGDSTVDESDALDENDASNPYTEYDLQSGLDELSDIMDVDNSSYKPIKQHVARKTEKAACKGPACYKPSNKHQDLPLPQDNDDGDDDNDDSINPEKESFWRYSLSKKWLLIVVITLCAIFGVLALVRYSPPFLVDAKENIVRYFNKLTGRGQQIPETEDSEPLMAH